MTRWLLGVRHTLVAAGIALAVAVAPARAQSEASLMLSALPVASVVGGAAALSAVPVALTISGAVLVVRTVEVSAQGTVIVLERLSDGARASIELGANAAGTASVVVGSSVVVSVMGAGVVLSMAGEVLCFIPNELGRALLHNERLTH